MESSKIITCACLALGLVQWSCLHVISVNEVNSNAVTERLDCAAKEKDVRECHMYTKWLNVQFLSVFAMIH